MYSSVEGLGQHYRHGMRRKWQIPSRKEGGNSPWRGEGCLFCLLSQIHKHLLVAQRGVPRFEVQGRRTSSICWRDRLHGQVRCNMYKQSTNHTSLKKRQAWMLYRVIHCAGCTSANTMQASLAAHVHVPLLYDITVPHLPVTLAQLMRSGIGQNTSCTVDDFA